MSQPHETGAGQDWGKTRETQTPFSALWEAERERSETRSLGELTWTPVREPPHKRIPVLLFQPGEQGLEVVEQWSNIHLLFSYNVFQCTGPGFRFSKFQHLAT